MRNHKLKVLSVALLLLSGCSNTGSNGGSGTTSANEEATTLENPVRLDQLGILPASDSSASSYLLQLTNYSKDKYTLDSVRVIDLDTGKDSTLVSVASQACSTVSANGSCSIQLTPHTLSSADVKLEVKIKDKQGEIRTLYQLIRVSSKLNAKTAGIAMVNDVSRILSEDGNYSLSIPVVLGESYDDIKASNGSLICNTEGYQKGSSCTYQVSGKVSGANAVVSTRLEGIKAGKTATVQEANTKVEVGKGAHLLLSHGTVINTPETSGEITIFNSGNTEAASVTSTTTDTNLKLGIAADACQATIGAGDSCKIKVDVTGNTNGQGVVDVAYKDGADVHKAIANVEYTVADAVAGVSFTQISSDLENALIGGKTRIAEIEIKNTSNRSLNNIKYYLAPANGEFKVVAGSDPACGLDGKHTLAVGASCLVKVEYTPTSKKTGGSINLILNGEYTDQHGQEHSLVKEHGLSYSATKAGALSWSKQAGSISDLIIQSNGTDTKEAVWDLRNTIAADEGLSATLTADMALNPNNIAGLSVAAEPAGGCENGATIAGNAKCSYKVTYGPVSAPQIAIGVALQAKYTLGGEAITTDSDNFQVMASATPIAQIVTKVTVKKSPSGLLGTGELLEPYSFTALSNNMLELDYTFNNAGTADAASFNVATASLPAGTSVIVGDCPTGTTTATLAAGASCTTTVSIPNPNLFGTPNLTISTLNGAKLDISLPYSYSKDDGSIVVENQPANRTYVQFSRLWGTISQTTESNNETSSDYTFDIKSIVNVPVGVSGVSKPITVRPYLANPISGANLQSCTIAEDEDSCINKLTLPKSKFTPGAPLKISFEAKGTGMADKDAIINTFPLIVANPDVKLSLDSQYEPVWYTNAEGLDVLPGNHGYIHLTNAGISNSGKVTAKALQQAEVIDNECATSGVPANGECYIEIKATGSDPQVQVTSEYGATLTFSRHHLGKYGRIQGVISGSYNATVYPEATVRPLRIQGDAQTLANGTLSNNLAFYAGDTIGYVIPSSTEYPRNTQLSALIQNHFQVTLGRDSLRLTHVPEITAAHLGTHAKGPDILAVRTAFIDASSSWPNVPKMGCNLWGGGLAYTDPGYEDVCDYSGDRGPTAEQRKATREHIYRTIGSKGDTGAEGYTQASQQIDLKDVRGKTYRATVILGSSLARYHLTSYKGMTSGGNRPAILGGIYTTTGSGITPAWGNFTGEDHSAQGQELNTLGTGGTYRFEVFARSETMLEAGTYTGEVTVRLGQSANRMEAVKDTWADWIAGAVGRVPEELSVVNAVTGLACRWVVCRFGRTTDLNGTPGTEFPLTDAEKLTFVTVKIPIQVVVP